MEFRYLTAEDAEEASAFVHDMWVDTYAPIVLGGRERAENIFDDWIGPNKIRRDMSRGHFFIYIVEEGKEIGLMSAGKEDDGLEISKIYLLPEYRGRGLGRKCMEFMMERGRELGCKRAYLEANHDNKNALAFYESLGFRQDGINQYDHSYTLVMARELRSP